MISSFRHSAYIAMMLSLVGCASTIKPTAVVHTDVIVQAPEPVALVKEDAQPTVNEEISDVVAVEGLADLTESLVEVKEEIVPFEFSSTEVECLAQNLYLESRGEPTVGQVAVAWVVINRSKDKRFPNTICGVIRQAVVRNGKVVKHRCAFSWYCDGIPDRFTDRKSYEKVERIAMQVLKGEIASPVGGALFFDSRPRKHAGRPQRAIKIGNHYFY